VNRINLIFSLTIILIIGMTQEAAGQTNEPQRLFLIDGNSAFIDTSGQVVISSSQAGLIEEIRRVSKELGGFRGGDEATISIRFGEFSEGRAVAGWALCPMCRNPLLVNGIVDETGRLVIPPIDLDTRYGSFHEGLARYSDRGWGFIDRSGRIVIPAKFYEAGDFSEGLAVIRSSEKSGFGYINQKGRLVIPCSFEWAGDFHEGLAAVAITKGKYGFIDKTGRVVFHKKKDWFEAGDFSGGLAAVQVEVVDNSVYRGYRDRKYGFIDRTGRLVVSPQFYRVWKFSEGLALFIQSGAGYGFIDSNGTVVVKPEYADGKSFSEGLAAVAVKTADEKLIWGYLDKDGQWAIRPQFQNGNSFSGGLAAVNCDQYGARCRAYIDRTGSVRWPKS
jgi:WG containing repeat